MEYIYAVLLLHKLQQPVNETNLKKVIAATGADVDEAKVKTLIASLQGINISAELTNAIAVAPVAAVTVEEKEEEKQAESAAGLASLFG